MHPLQISIGFTIGIGRESWCLPYAGFFQLISNSHANLVDQQVELKRFFLLDTFCDPIWSICNEAQCYMTLADKHVCFPVDQAALTLHEETHVSYFLFFSGQFSWLRLG